MLQEENVLRGVKVIDLFAGIGGFHLAMKSFGAEIVYAVEWDKDAASVYEENYGLKPAGDITKIAASSVPDHNIACLGFPCQAFSISGNQLGFEDSRGTLFFDAARIAKEKKPEVLFIENVKNLVGHDKGRTFSVILNTIEEIGYNYFWKVLDASDYGVPQSRKRTYIVCFRKDLNVTDFKFPEPIPLLKRVKDILVSDEEALKYKISRQDVQLKKYEEPANTNKPIRIGIVNKGGQGERIYSPEGTAITLSAYGGGAGSKTGLYFINGMLRKLTPRECARLNGFPDSFVISPNKNVAYKQFGNSVVVDVLQRIVEKIVKEEKVMKVWNRQEK